MSGWCLCHDQCCLHSFLDSTLLLEGKVTVCHHLLSLIQINITTKGCWPATPAPHWLVVTSVLPCTAMTCRRWDCEGELQQASGWVANSRFLHHPHCTGQWHFMCCQQHHVCGRQAGHFDAAVSTSCGSVCIHTQHHHSDVLSVQQR